MAAYNTLSNSFCNSRIVLPVPRTHKYTSTRQMVMHFVNTTHQVNVHGSIHQQLSQVTVIWHGILQALRSILRYYV